MATIETKFGLGDVVVNIWRRREQVEVPCPNCKGVGSVTVDGVQFSCTSAPCYGKGYKTEWRGAQWIVERTLTLGKIEVSIRVDRREEQYMAVETGVGSGAIYYAKDLFPTIEEAQAECDQRNEKEAADE